MSDEKRDFSRSQTNVRVELVLVKPAAHRPPDAGCTVTVLLLAASGSVMEEAGTFLALLLLSGVRLLPVDEQRTEEPSQKIEDKSRELDRQRKIAERGEGMA